MASVTDCQLSETWLSAEVALMIGASKGVGRTFVKLDTAVVISLIYELDKVILSNVAVAVVPTARPTYMV
ncbi:hypothetical protein D3C85_1498020 [compost metagenome]